MSLDLTAPIYNDPDAAREHLEALHWPDGPVCPHCGSYENIAKVQGKSARPGLYYCNACKGQFTVTVGTVFERSKIPLHKWVLATHLLCSSKKGMSAKQLERMLGVTYKTAWFMAHRIRESMKDDPDHSGPMGGGGQTVEADETYIGRDKSKEGTAVWDNDFGWRLPRNGQAKYKVVSLVERGGRARSVHVPEITSKRVRDILVTNVRRESALNTDEARYYTAVGKEYATHETVNHSASEYVRGGVHTNTIEGYFSIFKRGMKGVYQHCSEKHLHRYLCEFDYRYNEREALGVDDFQRSDKALANARGKRLTYRRTSERAHQQA